ncbi:MAG: ATP synthase subunit I [Candidatus Ventricola sp.]
MEHQKPQKTVLRETKRIAIGEVVLLVIMWIVYALTGRFSLAVVLGGLIGGAYAVFNFFMLGMTVQKAAQVQPDNAEMARMQMKSSYNMRMVGMLAVAVLAFALPFVDGLAAVIPLLFPRLTILALQLTGQIKDT